MKVSLQVEDLAAAYAAATREKLNRRQVEAIASIYDAWGKIRDGAHTLSVVAALRKSIRSFLLAERVPGLKDPSRLQAPVKAMSAPMCRALTGYQDCSRWEAAIRSDDTVAAGFAGFKVAEYVLHFSRSTALSELYSREFQAWAMNLKRNKPQHEQKLDKERDARALVLSLWSEPVHRSNKSRWNICEIAVGRPGYDMNLTVRALYDATKGLEPPK